MSVSRINNNIASINANRNLDKTNTRIAKSIERLSSGLRINRAGDDAAGLTVASRLKAQTQGLDRAVANAQDGINLINVAEGALEETTVRLNRLRVLAIQSANTGVNDLAARKALQDEVFQSVDEISRIAQTTQFNTNRLLNGDFEIKTEIKAGQVDIGLEVDASPVASTLENGQAFLNIIKLQNQDHKIVTGDAAGGQQTFNAGTVDATDVAISVGFFTDEASLGSALNLGGSADNISDGAFNNVSVASGLLFAFDGVLADGVTKFTGSVSTDTSLGSLASAINIAISAAETSVFGTSIDTGFDLSAYYTNGRINLAIADGTQNFSQASINLRLLDGSDIVTEALGVTRTSFDEGQVLGFTSSLAATGQIGNNVSAITGSTFASGQFEITVEDVQAAQQRTVKSTVAFTDQTGVVFARDTTLVGGALAAQAAVNGTFDNGVYTGFGTLQQGDTITLTGTNRDGTTFTREFTLTDANGTDYDGGVNTISGLIRELNNRLYSNGIQGTFNAAIATYAPDGTIKVIEEKGENNSELNFTLTFNMASTKNAPSGSTYTTINDDAILLQEGFEEQANININGGPSVRVNAGDIVTLYGEESTIDGVPTPEVTLRIGRGLTAGTDVFETTAAVYEGRLNGGPAVTFSAGDQDVQFIDGRSVGQGVAKVTTIDFDNIINVTKASGGVDPGSTVILSTVNASMNFQIGAFSGQNFQISIGNLTSDALGFGVGSGRALVDIDITSLTGANEALDIIDEALDQVNRTRSLLGAATNRLEATISNISVSSENLTASESRLRDADVARESTEFTRNQVLLQAGISVLAQANFTSQGFLALLG